LAEANLNADDVALLPVEDAEVSSLGVRNSAGVDEVGRDSVAVEEELLTDVGGENSGIY
jgi:hypothetical protein